MTVAAHVVLLLAIARDPTSEAVAQLTAKAAATPFVEPPQIALRIVSRPPSPAEVKALARSAAAERVVLMTCAGRGCERAEVRTLDDAGQPASRSVHFDPVDEPNERGRALGLLVSTLLPDTWSRTQPPPDPAHAPTAAADAPAVPAIAALASPPAAATHWGIETEIALLLGTAGDFSDGAITLTAERTFTGGWSARAGLKFELGDLPIAGGTSKGFGPVLGVGWTSAGLSRPHHFGVALRADLLAMARFERFASETEVEGQDKLAFGADLSALVGFAVAERTAVLAGVGAEYLPDVTRLSGASDDLQRAGPDPLRLTLQVGVLSRF